MSEAPVRRTLIPARLSVLADRSISPGEEGVSHSRHAPLLAGSRSSPASRRGAPSPMRQRKRQPSLSLNKIDSVAGTYKFYRVATAIGVVRPLAGLGSMDINNARCYFGRHLRPTTFAVSCLAMAKIDKNPETCKKKWNYFTKAIDFFHFYLIFSTETH